MEEMCKIISPDGIMQTYFCGDRPRVSPEVCVNVLRFFYRFCNGCDQRIAKTEDWVVQCLRNRAYIFGNRVYTTPETFLVLPVSALHRVWLGGAVSEAGEASRGLDRSVSTSPANALALALRLRACQIMGIDEALLQPDYEKLLSLQEADGGWPAGHFCCMGRTGAKIGNRGLTTAVAVRILESFGRRNWALNCVWHSIHTSR